MDNLLNGVLVTDQGELDSIPEDFKGKIKIDFGDESSPALVRDYDGVPIIAINNSVVMAYRKSEIIAMDNSVVYAYDDSSVMAHDNSRIIAWSNSAISAYGNSKVSLYDKSKGVIQDNAIADCYNDSSVVAMKYATIQAYDNSRIKAIGFSQVLDLTKTHNIETFESAKIKFMSDSIDSFLKYYDIPVKDNKVNLYKAVHKVDGRYISDYNRNFEYKIGAYSVSNFRRSVLDFLSLHLSSLPQAVKFGERWPDMAILECRCSMNDILISSDGDNTIKTNKLKVVREVPKEEYENKERGN